MASKSRESVTSPRRVRAVERAKQVLEWRAAGLSYQQIGDKLGVSRGTVYKMATRALRATRYEAVSDYRRLALGRLEALWCRLWLNLHKGDLSLAGPLLQCHDRISKLLGLDEPVVLEGVSDEDIAAEITRLQNSTEGDADNALWERFN